jgi:hypothetical protein
MPAYWTAPDLVAATSQAVIDRYFDDDGDGIADPGLVTQMILNASSAIDAVLLKGFSADAIVQLALEPLFKHHGAYATLHMAAKRRPEWRDAQGNAPYRTDWNDAMKYYADLAAGNARSQKESTAGTHPIIGGHQIANAPPLPTYVFAPDPNRGNPGGSGGY